MKEDVYMLKSNRKNSDFISYLIPISCILMGYLLWRFVLGNASGFTNPDKDNLFWPQHRGPIDAWNRMYEGGIIVPVLIGLLFIVVVFSIERFITLSKAKGKGSNKEFVRKIQHYLSQKDLKSAFLECHAQKGSLANVVLSGLESYEKMITDTKLTTEKKVRVIQKKIDEATSLELPIMQKNLTFLSTITSLSTLVALLGTVIGMIRSFAALGEGGGAASASELAVGISEALYNTATGIAASALSLVMYNIFTSKIDAITQAIEEASFTLTQSFNSLYK